MSSNYLNLKMQVTKLGIFFKTVYIENKEKNKIYICRRTIRDYNLETKKHRT